jgi:hypothetical protein
VEVNVKYQVKFKLAASFGVLETRTVEVDAIDVGDAIVQASLKLDDDKIDRWSLSGVVPVSS